MSKEKEATSLKQLFQGMVPEDSALMEGVVVKASPLSIQIANNPKMVASGNNLICPKHLTNYSTGVTIALGEGQIDSTTTRNDSHTHKLDTFGLVGAVMTVHNALRVGEKVWLLRFKNGKQYFILDRVVS